MIGTIVILLTIGVMEGMEKSIFRKMESFHFSYTGKLNDDIFFNNEFDVYTGKIKKYLIAKDNDYKVITITSLNEFTKFKDSCIQEYLIAESDHSGIILGKGLANDLNIKINDKITIASPLDVDIISSNIPMSEVNVSGIFNYKIMDYDYNYAFISNKENLKILNYKDDKLFIKSHGKNDVSENIIKKYNLQSWKDHYGEFLKAINTEKLLYSLFGYMLIIIASISSISLMSLFVMRKTKQIAILRALGIKNIFISNIFIINAILISAIGISIGSLIYLLLISLNYKYNFIQGIFFANLVFDFSIDFNFNYILPVFIISCIFMIISTMYPILKISKINLIEVLNNKF